MAWRVTLGGDPEVLDELARDLAGATVCVARARGRARGFIMLAPLDDIDTKRVATKLAKPLVEMLSGAARLLVDDLDVDTRIAIASIEYVAENVEAEPQIARVGGVAMIRGDQMGRVSTAGRWLERALEDPFVAKLLMTIGRGIWWDDAEKVQ